jgi:hypothetical protein
MNGTIGSRAALAAIVGCVAAASLVMAGCGGGSSTSTTGASGTSGTAGSASLSQDEFVSQADAACKEANDKITALKAPASTLSAQAATIAQEVGIFTDALGKLSAITPPTDLQSEYSRWLAGTKAQVSLATKAGAAAKANDTAKVQALGQQLQANNDKLNATAKDLGLTECAKHVEPQG